MTDEEQVDDRMAAQFAGDEELPDDGFSGAVVARIHLHRRRRRRILSVAMSATAVGIAVAMAWMPGLAEVAQVITPVNAIAILVLAAACSLIWIATEPTLDIRLLARAAATRHDS